MKTHNADIIILGAGIVGLGMALCAKKLGLSVICIEQQNEIKKISDSMQARTVAINPSSTQLLDEFNIWQWIDRTRIGLIKTMTIIDSSNDSKLTMDAKKNQQDHLALVIENQHLQAALYQACITHSIDCHFNERAETLSFSDSFAEITTDQQTYTAKLIVGADGAHSWLRQAADINKSTHDYRQFACIGLANSEQPHHDNALQTFAYEKIVGALPMAKPHLQSIIFSCSEQQKDTLLQADENNKNCMLTNALNMQRGFMSWQSPIKAIKLECIQSEYYVKKRIALIGDSAHRIHPFAGLGANLGFADVLCLKQTLQNAIKNKKDIGNLKSLQYYQRIQRQHNANMIQGLDIIKATFNDPSLWISYLREKGLAGINQSNFIKNKFIDIAN